MCDAPFGHRGSGPVRTAKQKLDYAYRAVPAGLAGVPKVFLHEGGESAATGIQNECAVARVMCDGPILSRSERGIEMKKRTRNPANKREPFATCCLQYE
jgi:hypothetical protein